MAIPIASGTIYALSPDHPWGGANHSAGANGSFVVDKVDGCVLASNQSFAAHDLRVRIKTCDFYAILCPLCPTPAHQTEASGFHRTVQLNPSFESQHPAKMSHE